MKTYAKTLMFIVFLLNFKESTLIARVYKNECTKLQVKLENEWNVKFKPSTSPIFTYEDYEKVCQLEVREKETKINLNKGYEIGGWGEVLEQGDKGGATGGNYKKGDLILGYYIEFTPPTNATCPSNPEIPLLECPDLKPEHSLYTLYLWMGKLKKSKKK